MIDLKTELTDKSGKCFTQVTSELARKSSENDHKYRVVHRMGGTMKVLRKISSTESEKTNFMKVNVIKNEPGHFEFTHDFPENLSVWAIYYLSGTVQGVLDLSGVELTNYLITSRSDYQKDTEIYTRSHVLVQYRQVIDSTGVKGSRTL